MIIIYELILLTLKIFVYFLLCTNKNKNISKFVRGKKPWHARSHIYLNHRVDSVTSLCLNHRINSSSSSSCRTDRWVNLQRSKTLAYECLCTLAWIVHGIDDCYQLTRTFGGSSAQCFSKLFLKEFTVLLVTT